MKRVALIIAAALLSVAAPALAQDQAVSGNCSGYAALPNLPDGARATHAAMTRGGERLDEWRRQREARMALCLAEINAVRAQLNAMEQAYNQVATERNNAIASWNAEVAEFGARGQSRERGGVLTRPD